MPASMLSEVPTTSAKTNSLPINAIVKALCQAANSGPELLYEVMLKLSLVVEATAPMYGMSIWNLHNGQRPQLEWVEGLNEEELLCAEAAVSDVCNASDSSWSTVQLGDTSVCFVLASVKTDRPMILTQLT